MLSSSVGTQDYHAATKHSVRSVQLDPNYVDARTQPVAFKAYPHFYRRFPLDRNKPFERFLALTSAITWQKQYRDCLHSLRVQPSAGALYPTELYIQLRGISGWLDGIYHLEPRTEQLTLIYELIDDGLEGYVLESELIKGCIILVSCVYFRSSWKYKNRSLRYCFLDSGHHIGAIEAAAYAVNDAINDITNDLANYRIQTRFEFDQLALNDDLGLAEQEFVTAAVILGATKPKTVRRLRSPLPTVTGTDYFEPNRFIEAGYKQTLATADLAQSSVAYPAVQFPAPPTAWLKAIEQRRSARRFYPHPISQTDFATLCSTIQQPWPSHPKELLQVYAVIHRVEGLAPGLYRFRQAYLDCLKVGEFPEQAGHLCISQAIARDCAVVFFIAADYQNYRVAMQLAGWLGQRLYLTAAHLNIGCSGIGAYYDDETQVFLATDQPILYALALGQTPDLMKEARAAQ